MKQKPIIDDKSCGLIEKGNWSEWYNEIFGENPLFKFDNAVRFNY